MGKTKYTKEVLIKIIKQKAGELKCLPRTKDVIHIYGTIYNRFGGLKEAFKAAGLPWESYSNRKYSDEFLIEILRRRTKELKRPVRTRDISRAAVIIQRFGSWKNALKIAGLSLELYPNKKYTDEQLLIDIKRTAKKIGKMPGIRDVKFGSACARRFNGWGNAIEKAGLGPYKKITKKPITEKKLIDEIIRTSKKLNKTPLYHHLKHYRTILRRFKTLENALKKAGLK